MGARSEESRNYSLKHFNECFDLHLNAYQWRYARWHSHIFLAAQTPIASATLRWRHRGAGADGTLPHAAIVEAGEFIMEYLIFPAEGVHRVRLSSGSYQDFPAAQLQQCAEEVWRQYRDARGGEAAEPDGAGESVLERSRATGARRVSRSHFLHLVKVASQGVQKSYSALDTFSERNGRKQIEYIRGYCQELKELMAKLLVPSLMPAGAEPAAAQRERAEAVRAHAVQLERKVDRVETHIKRGIAQHAPSCDVAAPAVGEAWRQPTCPEHCPACAFGTAGGDPSRAAKCTLVHTVRCVQCVEIHSLQPDFDVLLKSAERTGR